MTAPPSDPLIGHTLDERYVIRAKIARGGMAMVYLANDLRLERRVAVKIMHEHLAEDENFTRRFEQEARSAAGLSHPNLVNVFDQGHDAGRSYLVMEYLPSITLRALLKKQHSLTQEQTLEISEAILSGLAAAHHAGIVHRDLKPENVLLADDGRIKLGDFGLARAVSANTTTGQALLGTIAYLSPELVTRGVADARSDLYSFGIMIYEMLTGSQPFTGEQPMQIAYQHAHGEVPVPSLASTESSPGLDAFVRWLTARDPEDRPLDAGEALDELRSLVSNGDTARLTKVLPSLPPESTSETTVLNDARPPVEDEGEPEHLETPIDSASNASTKRTKRGRVLAVLAVLAVAAAGFGGWWFGQGPGARAIVPELSGLEIAEAESRLSAQTLEANVTDCSSVDVPVGLVVSSDPAAGTRVDRGGVIDLCRSSGPALIPVPTIVGLSLTDAQDAIEAAGFSFGEVLETRFTDTDKDLVLAAIGEDGDALADEYPEQGRVDLIVSAGPLPDVSGKDEDEAQSILEKAGLVVDSDLENEAYSDDVPEDRVISIVTSTDPVRPGDAVGLTLSLGPELFEVPDVEGMPLQDAMDALEAAGFVPTNLVPERLRGFAEASGTDPEEGSEVPAGTEIRVKSTIRL